jgi:TRAP-type mannitol/chloroaromatic compound transport system permease small subunit
MGLLMGFSRGVDWINERFGRVADWCILLACAISAANALLRYGLNFSNNAWIEVQWYLFAAVVMLGASYTLFRNEHVRVDIVYGLLGERGRLWMDVFGFIAFLLPAMALLTWMTWPFFVESFVRNEGSPAPGGLLRWPAKILLPLGFGLIVLQGLSELIKRIALLRGIALPPGRVFTYQRPEQ